MEILVKEFGVRFSTRPRARGIFDALNFEEKVTLNFEDVETATPSFLHEVLIIFREKNTEFEFMNMSNSINFQLKKAIQALD